MAANEIETENLKDWEDAFQHPLANIRKLEVRLRSDAEANRQKLRTIVGASYRDLLGTADRIIEMDKQMRSVEASLSLAGQKCNVKSVERIFASTKRFDAVLEQKRNHDYTLASHMALLQRSASVISRLLKHAGSPLVAAKVLVLSRLLHKVLSQSGADSSLLESSRKRLASLRRRLLFVIDQKLADSDADRIVLIDHMCAFSLTTNATPTDILRHFHHVRLQAIDACLQEEDGSKADPSKAVRLLVKTSQSSQLIFPKRLSDALSKLKGVSLLQQTDVINISELELDVHGRWIAEELRNYTPWPRHDELQKPEADKQLKLWIRSAVKSFVTGLERGLKNMSDFGQIVAARKAIFTSWPWADKDLPGLDSEEIVDKLREIINDRMLAVIQVTLEQLKTVFSQADLNLSTVEKNAANLWDPLLVAADASSGASAFKSSILQAYSGNDSVSAAVIRAYDAWIASITAVMTGIKELKDDRWDIEIGEDDGEVDSEARRTLLSEDDPRELEDALSEAMASAFKNFQTDLQTRTQKFVDDQSDVSSMRTIICLRILRELSRRSIGEGFSRKLQIASVVESRMITPLQIKLAKEVLETPMKSYGEAIVKSLKSRKAISRALWEGTPPLPLQPSTAIFRLMRDLNTCMGAYGSDIWSSGTVSTLKGEVFHKLQDVLHKSIEEVIESEPSSGTGKNQTVLSADKDDADEIQPADKAETQDLNSDATQEEPSISPLLTSDQLVQLNFDFFYARSAFVRSDTVVDDDQNSMPGFLQSLHKPDEAETARLQKNAVEYWKRSYLMFALLSD